MIAAAGQSMEWIVWGVALGVCTAFDAMFCGLETGIYVMNKNRLDLQAEGGRASAVFLQRMLRRPDRLLAVLLIGANLTRYVSTFAISAMFVLAGRQAGAEVYTLLVAAPLFFVVSDSGPKSIFQRLGAGGVYKLIWLLRAANRVFWVTGLCPLVMGVASLLLKLTRAGRQLNGTLGHEGVAAVVDEGHASGVLTRFQSAMADRVMHIQEVTVGDVMIPTDRVVSVPRDIGRDELIEIIRPHNYSRFPMLDDDGRVAGVLNIYDVLVDEDLSPPADKMTAPLVIPADVTVTDALHRMRRGREAMGIIERDERYVGIVTIKDLVEEIVGELEAW